MPVSVAQAGGAGYESEGTCVQRENGKGTQGHGGTDMSHLLYFMGCPEVK